jgi:hypothetical protein
MDHKIEINCNGILNITNKQSNSQEDNTHLSAQEIPRLIWTQKVQYRFYSIHPTDPVLRHMNLV